MGPIDMSGISNEIFRRRFPVGRQDRPARRAHELDTAGDISPEIEIKGRVPQKILQGWSLGIQASKNEAPVTVDQGNLTQTVVAAEFGAVFFVSNRNVFQVPVNAVCPAMIGA